ncbi:MULTISPECIES: biotin-dependent carboxyltransferase family protein [unclassified Kitasatospora]|uniref:5-oxoprolinase subunit C family protein n=1 Tax=unclassified Kitasatospora TaxID=2633591 RepID=UPI000708E96E|nr:MULTISPECIES: biotin-dependent carboxyltransferase family protein [unclassified Kitasatospora]KQV15668.1 allophanate hydrolase [Kitasatospora sp. Root107]KRB71651.1 allophanate hydrolase [Kitasatospora sp. Root187]
MTGLVVVRPGPLTTVQDLGRRGVAHLGVPRAGALDEPALRAANRLVGNPAGTAGLETTLGGVALRAVGPQLIAVTGAPAAVRLDGRSVAWGAAVTVPDGSVLDLGPATHGVRGYLAVAGGLAVPPVLGSRSADLLSGLGPAPLTAGQLLPVGPRFPGDRADLIPLPAPPAELVLRLHPGPHLDWFAAAARPLLARSRYLVATASNRIALRTEGPALPRSRSGELPSEGMVLGAVQVPPDGRPVIFLADHPTTGGYPVIGVVPTADLPAAAQARPGTPVRFVPLTR